MSDQKDPRDSSAEDPMAESPPRSSSTTPRSEEEVKRLALADNEDAMEGYRRLRAREGGWPQSSES